MMRRFFTKRLFVYLLSLAILGCGICMNTKTQLGVSPVISVAYTIAVLCSVPIGLMTFLYYCFLILLQWLMLRDAFERRQLLQAAASFVTSAFIQLFDAVLPVFQTPLARGAFLILGVVLTGIGASLSVGMRYVPNPADGLADVIGRKLHKDMGFGKNLLDLICICISLFLGFLFRRSLLGVGLGTVVAMLLTGRVVAAMQKTTDRIKDAVTGDR